ncbi:hypothetical protein [Rhodoligotrophos ferricapiens]|uniref:hypothetical protein n=1 Tax=Rhodoligotrophos ferricapiens TaxID=3069264 RepID=UPI00315E00A6
MNPVRPRQAGSSFAAIALMLKQVGGVDTVASYTGRRESTVYRWTDPDQSDGIPFNIVCQISEHFGITTAAEHLAIRSGGWFLPNPAIEHDDELASAAAQAAAEYADLIHRYAKALDPKSEAGRQVSPREAGEMVTGIDELYRALAVLRALALAISERGNR